MSTYCLDRIFNPKSIALIGGSPRLHSIGAAVIRNIRAAAFPGQLAVVNPRHRLIENEATFATLAQLPVIPDLIIITAPAATVRQIIDEAGSLGVGGAVILSSGLGHGPGSIEDIIRETARKSGIRLIGPNCLGVLIPRSRLNASFAAQMSSDGRLALISQSGAVVAAMIAWAAERKIGFSGIVSIGDQIDVDIADCLDFFAADRKTHAILLYIEAIPDARKFMSAARAAARLKPVVVVKSGRHEASARAAATHTGALAGSDAVYDAAFRRAGLLRVFDLRELFDCAAVLATDIEPQGRRLAVLTNGGGLAILALDRLIELGGHSPSMSPIDLGGDAGAEDYQQALEDLLKDPDNDAVLVINVPTAIADPTSIAAAVSQTTIIHRLGNPKPKPVLTAFVGASSQIRACFNATPLPSFSTEDEAVRAFINGVHHHDAIQSLMKTPPSILAANDASRIAAKQLIQNALRSGREWLDPIEIADVLGAYGIFNTPVRKATSADEAASAANEFLRSAKAVVMKILSPNIVHKSDVNGVMLDLRNADDVRQGFSLLIERVKAACPSAEIEGVIIQPMITRPQARELVAGIADDCTFGPVIVFGSGGLAVEKIADRALSLPPLDGNLAADLIQRTRAGVLLDAYRNIPAANRDAIASILIRLSHLAADLPEIRELDINPLLADHDGVTALDTRIRISTPKRMFAGNTRMAIMPYPVKWQKGVTLRDGTDLLIRPIKPEDEAPLVDLLQNTDPRDVRLRFLGARKDFSHAFVAALTQIDYARAMAFVAISETDHRINGVARLHCDSDLRSAEYAILVRSDLQGRGIGWVLMLELIRYAASEGIAELRGEVLKCNEHMLEMCRSLGFRLSDNADDHSIAAVTLDLPAKVAV